MSVLIKDETGRESERERDNRGKTEGERATDGEGLGAGEHM